MHCMGSLLYSVSGDEEQVMLTYICIPGMTCLRLAQIRGSQSHQNPCIYTDSKSYLSSA
mgnify:CR=1 FL=1